LPKGKIKLLIDGPVELKGMNPEHNATLINHPSPGWLMTVKN